MKKPKPGDRIVVMVKDTEIWFREPSAVPDAGRVVTETGDEYLVLFPANEPSPTDILVLELTDQPHTEGWTRNLEFWKIVDAAD